MKVSLWFPNIFALRWFSELEKKKFLLVHRRVLEHQVNSKKQQR